MCLCLCGGDWTPRVVRGSSVNRKGKSNFCDIMVAVQTRKVLLLYVRFSRGRCMA